jgi:hypothetical protein
LQFHGQLERLAVPRKFNFLLRKLSEIEWVVYAKEPFGGPEKVVDYVGRYTHRVAISNQRLEKLEDGKVRFRWKDYRRSHDGNGTIWSIMTLDAHEFIRRFLLHVLPRRFVRIRRYGILCNRKRATKLALCHDLLQTEQRRPPPPVDWQTLYARLTGRSIGDCSQCRRGKMQVIETIPSFRELMDELRLGCYLPHLLLSRAMAICFERRKHRLKIQRDGHLVTSVPRLDSS